VLDWFSGWSDDEDEGTPLPPETPDIERMLIVGASGGGKSSLARKLLTLRKPFTNRRALFDPEDEYGDFAAFTARTRQELHDIMTSCRDREEWSVRYVPPIPESVTKPDDIERAEAEECGVLAQWSLHLERNILMVDEAHDSCGRFCSPWIVRHVKRGRHHRAYLWVISQRPADILPKIRAECGSKEAWYFQITEHVDLEVIQARRGREFAQRVERLPQFHALRLRRGELEPEEWRVEWKGGASPDLVRVS